MQTLRNFNRGISAVVKVVGTLRRATNRTPSLGKQLFDNIMPPEELVDSAAAWTRGSTRAVWVFIDVWFLL